MIRPVPTLLPEPKVKSSARQNAYLSAERGPPPGQVGMSVPGTACEFVTVVSRAAGIVPGTHTGRWFGKN